MIDNSKNKFIGDENDRAVSPVIGVILMVAITVILAAVIAAFVLDLGDSIGEEAQSGVSMTFDDSAEELSIELTSEGNADDWEIRGDYYVDDDGFEEVDGSEDRPYEEFSQAGDTLSLECVEHADSDADYALGDEGEGESGTVTVVASIDGDDSWTTVGSEDWECSDE